jgi:radical SAM/Cys-rich protein
VTAVPLRVLETPPPAPASTDACCAHGGELRAERVTTLQINVGKKCNQACRHCHVDAGPLRTEVMPDAVVDACLAALARGARMRHARRHGRRAGAAPALSRDRPARARARPRTIVRHNLTVQQEPGQEDLPEFLAAQQCEVVASLPHYTEDATDRQRGRGVYDKSVAGLVRLNAVGYGGGRGLVLNLVSNPVGAFLPPRQLDLERDMRLYLGERHGIVFDRLFTITNMPIARFADWLDQHDRRAEYMERLESAFNPATLPGSCVAAS